ncbi:MAG: aminotransferase class III-fold pyridoxal phosphate-dependent enzyme [Desulfobacterales bacterium]|nr:aminotransferase class III-fold pyridoxal phosphate-dependent enzyme [Desulfobacterales bacterium]
MGQSELKKKEPYRFFRTMKFEEDILSGQQKEFVREFMDRFCRKTPKSKEYTQKYRPFLSDYLCSVNYRKTLKDIIYPIVHERSEGALIWDIDGNSYIDIAMGYGVSFFGNKAPFITQAIAEQLENGFELGPQSDTAGEVAQLISELTGVERVGFVNSGTEAVMAALRIARAVTGREKIVRFIGSYHGTFDGITSIVDGDGKTVPMAPGTLPAMLADVIMLDYGTDATLETIREYGNELAAVILEPVQSRRPDFHPKEFLQQLRTITRETGTALIFDEVMTGFRIHPGGCQAYFNIQADIVTYGKIVTGGLPMGIVAGKADFLDALDGGMWQYGDDSYPSADTTFIAGTFCKHPLSVAAARAGLLYMKEHGPKLQEAVNQRTAYFADTLNDFFKKENVAIKIKHFGSLFKFESFGKYSMELLPIEIELLFYLLVEKGVYTWEKRISFFSVTHTDEQVETVINCVKNSILEMRAGGFLLEAS